MEDFVHKPDTGRLVWELFGELDVDLPHTIGERCCVKPSFGQLRICIAAIRDEVARASFMHAWANSFPRHIVASNTTEKERRDILSDGPLNLTKNSDILLLTNVTS